MGRTVTPHRPSGNRGQTLMRAAQAGRMRKRLTGLFVLTALGAALSASAGFVEQSSMRVGTTTTPLKAWCDAPQGVVALGAFVIPGTGAASGVTGLTVWPKTRGGLGSPEAAQVRWGPPDAGAGNVYWPLTVLDGARKGQAGFLHTSNVENVQDPAYRMTHVNEVKLGRDVYRCRYVPQAAFLGVTAKRTVIVWDNGRTATYATRNFDGTPGVSVTGGKRIDFGTETGWGYEFTTPDGYRYTVAQGDFVPNPHMRLDVFKGGKAALYEPFVAYTASRPATD